MRNERGFSLIELLIVVAIIGIIAALAVPGLRSARQKARAGSAIQSLRMITTAEHLYERKFGVYGTFAGLAPEGTLDVQLSSGSKSGYAFNLAVVPPRSFTCTATPEEEPTRFEHYFVDETGVIRFEVGAAATAASPPIPR